MDKELLLLLERARSHDMTPEEFMEQRIGFAYGNASKSDQNTRETVKEIVTTQTTKESHVS